MGQTLQAGIAPGLALAGVLAVAGFLAARFGGTMPHLGAGALGVATAVTAARLGSAPVVVLVLVVAAGAALLGAAGWYVDERVRSGARALWPPALLPELAVLGLAVGAAAFLRPPLTVDLPVGPLGGFPQMTEAVVALVVGVAASVILSLPAVRAQRDVVVWAAASAAVSLAVLLGSGALALRAQAVTPVFGVADVVGLAVRAAAVGVVARYGVVWGVGAALVLGLVEGILTTSAAAAHVAVLPALALLIVGVVIADRETPAPEELEPLEPEVAA